jgi:hypothetical protein
VTVPLTWTLPQPATARATGLDESLVVLHWVLELTLASLIVVPLTDRLLVAPDDLVPRVAPVGVLLASVKLEALRVTFVLFPFSAPMPTMSIVGFLTGSLNVTVKLPSEQVVPIAQVDSVPALPPTTTDMNAVVLAGAGVNMDVEAPLVVAVEVVSLTKVWPVIVMVVVSPDGLVSEVVWPPAEPVGAVVVLTSKAPAGEATVRKLAPVSTSSIAVRAATQREPRDGNRLGVCRRPWAPRVRSARRRLDEE